ncbi:MAG: GNAT family N-acetyltransferase [Pedobacter sp.]|nr:MAG: GNAT family N-acetyltransferase [Pedobacter sp.]
MHNNQIEQIPYYLTWKLRHEVMYPELSIEDVKLENDIIGLHFGLYAEFKLTSVVSLFEQGNLVQLRKFATAQDQQGNGYGTQLLEYVIDFSEKTIGANILWCNARMIALPFYEKFGFKPAGDTWEAMGYTFIKMERRSKFNSTDTKV